MIYLEVEKFIASRSSKPVIWKNGLKDKKKNKYCIVDDVCIVELNGGQYTLIDKIDIDLLEDYTLSYNQGVAACGNIERTTIHRVLMSANPGEKVIHKNGDRLDNRRGNLKLIRPVVTSLRDQ